VHDPAGLEVSDDLFDNMANLLIWELNYHGKAERFNQSLAYE
jgi:hypothetical protein